MTKKVSIFIGVCLFVSGTSRDGRAEPRVHHPWFASKHHVSAAAKPPAKADVKQNEGVHPEADVVAEPAKHHPYLFEHTKAPHSQSSPDEGQRIAKDAMHYKGTRYVFGGTSRKGIDCSGLVMKVYDDIKSWKLPHASAAMYKMGHPVKENELRPGDLVFFKNTYKHGISHVGIYTGHNHFIHARNRHAGVTVSRLSDPYFQLHYAGARRLY